MTDRLTALRRAAFPTEAASILRARSLETDYSHLSQSLQPGQRVLDVGCGTGAMTLGIAKAVVSGEVIGIDINANLIAEAVQNHQLPNLSFQCADLSTLERLESVHPRFDLVVAARVLQWLTHPADALKQMVSVLRSGGKLFVLDYNHTKARLFPPPPETMMYFRKRYLDWRADAGMGNEIADHLRELMELSGLSDIRSTEQHELTRRGESEFARRISLWAEVASTRGHQVVADGYLSEQERQTAVNDFQDWMQNDAAEQSFYLLSVVGTKLA
ncbi:methyltransferase domain-containing protein [Deinococcus sp. KNUC1210]|uniref:methyltransferase domain-containing protein n=1 Tax=Deinococcus sp. KNUC1210 TaxID=2917691 RepID=UPI001EF0A8C8|nr:methyltransferase domain-containing protein [Deinococcus sp. KNUC1210]ULH16315.1 methyltransferase domain-containing protein [Deinococcus sp. KNUC1210]